MRTQVTLRVGKRVLEVGMVGHDGMLGAQLVLGLPLSHCMRSCKAQARRGVSRSAFQRAFKEYFAVREGIRGYLRVTAIQLARSAACLRFHHIGPRLARWLLKTHDRANSDHCRMTHEVLACGTSVFYGGYRAAKEGTRSGQAWQYHCPQTSRAEGDGLQLVCS
jgi:hypothetical protein